MVLKCNIESTASWEKRVSCVPWKSQQIAVVKSHQSSAFILRFSSDKAAHYQARTKHCGVMVDCQERGMLSLVVETITELTRRMNVGLELIMNAYVPLSLLDVKVSSCLKMKQPSQSLVYKPWFWCPFRCFLPSTLINAAWTSYNLSGTCAVLHISLHIQPLEWFFIQFIQLWKQRLFI